MGSVIDMRSPARLRHAGDEALGAELAQADAADAELPVDGAGAAAAAAAAVGAGLVLGGALLAHPLGRLGHGLGLLVLRGVGAHVRIALTAEGHAEGLEEGVGLRVGL